jgi:hypothetical protein
MLNQQFMTGCAYGQQGMQAEQLGNPAAAAQFSDQPVACIQQCMVMARSRAFPCQRQSFYCSPGKFQCLPSEECSRLAARWHAPSESGFVGLNQAIFLNPKMIIGSEPEP